MFAAAAALRRHGERDHDHLLAGHDADVVVHRATHRSLDLSTGSHDGPLIRVLQEPRVAAVQAQRREAWGAARRRLGLAWFARGLTAGRLVFVQAQRREAWGEPPHDAASSVVRPRPYGRSAFTYRALEREIQVRAL